MYKYPLPSSPQDYSGTAVNALNFLAVLAGNRSGIEISSIANGRVLESGPQDHVFVYYR